MAHVLIHIKDESQTSVLVDYLKSLSYIDISEVEESNFPVSHAEQQLMEDRLRAAKPDDFTDWQEVKARYKS